MINDWKMAVYWRLPVILQETALSIYARRLDRLYFGVGFREWQKQLNRWQRSSRLDLENWKNQRLLSLITLAAHRVPYYRKQWEGLDWKSVQSMADLHLLPRLEKQAIRQNEQAFIVEGLNPKSLWVAKTSGSTGTALRIYWPMAMLPKWWAFYEVCLNRAGVGKDVPRAMLGGRPIIPGYTQQPPYWRYNRHWRQLYLSSYHVSRETAPHYIAAIRQYGCQWITGYGSTIAALAENALEAGLPPLPLRVAVTSGDTLLPSMRSTIEEFFKCKCVDHYGQAEGVCQAVECSHGKMHVVSEAGIVEILRDDGSSCLPGEVGEIAATSLLNDAMPLIRYRLGDYAAWAENQDCLCGNQQPILANIVGRTDDYLVTSDGRKIGRLSTAFKRSPTIHSAQIVQVQAGQAYLLIRPSSGYQIQDALAVRDDILERIGSFNIEVIEVSEIPKTPQGKTALVVRLEDRPHLKEVYQELITV